MKDLEGFRVKKNARLKKKEFPVKKSTDRKSGTTAADENENFSTRGTTYRETRLHTIWRKGKEGNLKNRGENPKREEEDCFELGERGVEGMYQRWVHWGQQLDRKREEASDGNNKKDC